MQLDFDDIMQSAQNGVVDGFGSANTLFSSLMGQFASYFSFAGNILFVLALGYFFKQFPPRFTLPVGFFAALFGPSVIKYVFDALGILCMLAGRAPVIVCLSMWLAVLLASAFGQKFLMALGLDQNQDGKVDLADAWLLTVKKFKNTAVGKLLGAEELHTQLEENRSIAGNIHELALQLNRIEELVGGTQQGARKSALGLL